MILFRKPELHVTDISNDRKWLRVMILKGYLEAGNRFFGPYLLF